MVLISWYLGFIRGYLGGPSVHLNFGYLGGGATTAIADVRYEGLKMDDHVLYSCYNGFVLGAMGGTC